MVGLRFLAAFGVDDYLTSYCLDNMPWVDANPHISVKDSAYKIFKASEESKNKTKKVNTKPRANQRKNLQPKAVSNSVMMPDNSVLVETSLTEYFSNPIKLQEKLAKIAQNPLENISLEKHSKLANFYMKYGHEIEQLHKTGQFWLIEISEMLTLVLLTMEYLDIVRPHSICPFTPKNNNNN